MSNLIVDIGNTRVKIAVMVDNEVRDSATFGEFGEEAMLRVEDLVATFSLQRAIISSTRADAVEVSEMLRGVVTEVIRFDSTTLIPIPNSYESKETLGSDRLAAAVGAWGLYGKGCERMLIVDMGSAITIDLVTRKGGFEGGVISAGVGMRFRALHEFTAALPLCSSTERELEVARTTRDAIEQGVMEGVKYEIEGHIEKNRKKDDKIVVIFTGGDSKKFENRIKNTIFAERELVIEGLNRILEYNAK